MKKQLKIAIFGTFDVENYGDLLFPLIAKEYLKDLDVKLLAISPTSQKTRYEDAAAVMTFQYWKKHITEFRAIIVGGGNLIHWRDFSNILKEYKRTSYPELWAYASLLAISRNIPVIWNAPGVIDSSKVPIDKTDLTNIIKRVDLLTVRDKKSAEIVYKWTDCKANIIPDTAAGIHMLWSKKELLDKFYTSDIGIAIPNGKKITALHIKERSLCGWSIDSFVKKLRIELEKNNSVGLLLALGRCHGDHNICKLINDEMPEETIDLSNLCSLKDIASVICSSDGYIGSSLHGEITAFAYGTPSCLVALDSLHKFREQCSQLDRQHRITNDWRQALDRLPGLLSEKRTLHKAEVFEKLNIHWDMVKDQITRKKPIIDSKISPDDLGLIKKLENSLKKVNNKNVEFNKAIEENTKVINMENEKEYSKAIKKLISTKDFNKASHLINKGLEKREESLKLKICQIELFIAEKDYVKAGMLSDRLLLTHPKNKWVLILNIKCQTLLDKNNFAIHCLKLIDCENWSDDELYTAVKYIIEKNELGRQIEILLDMQAKFPKSYKLQVAIGMRYYQAGENDRAVKYLEKANLIQKLPVYAKSVLKRLAYVRSSQMSNQQLLEYIKNKERDLDLNCIEICRIARLYATLGEFSNAQKYMFEAVNKFPGEMHVIYVLNRIFLTEEAESSLLNILSKFNEENNVTASWLKQLVLFSLRNNKIVFSQKLLAELIKYSSESEDAQQIIHVLDKLGITGDYIGRISNGSNFNVVKMVKAKKTLVVFGNILGGIGYIPFGIADKLFANYAINIIYLKDPYSVNYKNGLPSHANDHKELSESLYEQCESFNVPVMTLGCSASAYVALKIGIGLKATHIFSLAGVLVPDTVKKESQVEVAAHHKSLFDSVQESTNLLKELDKRKNIKLVHFYGDSYKPDQKRAQTLVDITHADIVKLKNATTHHISLTAIINGKFQEKLKDAIDSGIDHNCE